MKPILLDGRTGEGGGQLVRLAVALSALTTRPVSITNVRGNRQGGRGGGLKSQHVTAIQFLASVTDAYTEGLSLGSKTLTFIPRLPPTALTERNFSISASSGAASTLLILQAILPFLLFAAGDPIHLTISGGTNAAFSLSFEYLDQVLLPTLEERFGVKVERQMNERGWSLGKYSRGEIVVTIYPIQKGEKMRFRPPPVRTYLDKTSWETKSVDVNIVAPEFAHERLQSAIVEELYKPYDASVHFKTMEDSGDSARVYILLVAHSYGGMRWGRDLLTSIPKKAAKSADTFLDQSVSKVCRDLIEDRLGEVDEFLQDQMICFQALAEGWSYCLRQDEGMSWEETVEAETAWRALREGKCDERVDDASEPFGYGSLHARTARWVVAEMLPEVKFCRKGTFVRGVSITFS